MPRILYGQIERCQYRIALKLVNDPAVPFDRLDQQREVFVQQFDQRARLHALTDGGWLIDTPGMRELQLVDVADAIEGVFADIAALARTCRFGDCSHQDEPGCAVLAAIGHGELDADRLRRYKKLQAEDRRNSASLAQRRSQDRQLGRYYKSVLAIKRREKDNN